MPVMTGTEATTIIRTTANGTDIPIIAISASAFEEDKMKIIKGGASAFIRKPFKESDVLNETGQLLKLEHIYEEVQVDSEQLTPVTASAEELSQTIIELPEQLIKELIHAATIGDMTAIKAVIETLDEDENKARKALAETLAKLADNYDYDAISELLE